MTGHSLWEAQRQAQEWMATLPAQPCRIDASPRDAVGPGRERTVGHWTVHCATAADAMLPVFLAPGMVVHRASETAPQTWEPVVPSRTCGDPRLRIDMPAGTTTLRVAFPNWRLASSAVFHEKPFDFRRDCPAVAERPPA